jgi:cytochrome b6-f complex iron-sulfur subunit
LSPDPENSERQPTRRSFLNFCIGSTFVAAAFGVVYPILKFLWPPSESLAHFREEIIRMPIGDVPVGMASQVLYKRHPLVVIRLVEDRVVVLSALCTHLNCLVNWDEETRRLVCPCHGAIFDINGTPLRGPAPSPLASYPAKIVGNEIVIGEA